MRVSFEILTPTNWILFLLDKLNEHHKKLLKERYIEDISGMVLALCYITGYRQFCVLFKIDIFLSYTDK